MRAAIANAVGTGERVRLRALAQRVVRGQRRALVGIAGAADHTRAAARRQADRAGAGRDRAHIDAQGAGVQTAAGVARVRVHPIAATLLHKPGRTGAGRRPDHRRQRRRRVVDQEAGAGGAARVAGAVASIGADGVGPVGGEVAGREGAGPGCRSGGRELDLAGAREPRAVPVFER